MKHLLLAALGAMLALQLGGCGTLVQNGITGAVSYANGALVRSEINRNTKPAGPAISQSIVLPRRVSPNVFLKMVRTIARDNKYDVSDSNLNTTGMGPLASATVTESHSSPVPVIGKSWAVMVTLELQQDGKTVIMSSRANGEGGPSADQIANEFKTGLLKQFS